MRRRRSRARSRFRRRRSRPRPRRRRRPTPRGRRRCGRVRGRARPAATMRTKPGTMNASPPTIAPLTPATARAQKIASWVEAGPGRRLVAATASWNSRGGQPLLALDHHLAEQRRVCLRAADAQDAEPSPALEDAAQVEPGRGQAARTAARKCSIVSRTATSSGVTAASSRSPGSSSGNGQRHVVEGDRPGRLGSSASIAATTSAMDTGVPGKSYAGAPCVGRAGGGDEAAGDVGRVVQLGPAAEGDLVRLAAAPPPPSPASGRRSAPGRGRGRRRRRGGCPRWTRPRRPSRRGPCPRWRS